jgi:hypothetical protein
VVVVSDLDRATQRGVRGFMFPRSATGRSSVETFVVIRCTSRGETFSRCADIWVDKDFAMVRYWQEVGTNWRRGTTLEPTRR